MWCDHSTPHINDDLNLSTPQKKFTVFSNICFGNKPAPQKNQSPG